MEDPDYLDPRVIASGLRNGAGLVTVDRTMNPLSLLNDHASALRALGARRIGVFGSVARGEATANSDVDVYVEFAAGQRTYDNFFALHELLEGLFHRSIDLVTDLSLTETQARLILPTVRYAALDAGAAA